MGLDITAYRQLKPCAAPEGAATGDYDYERFFAPLNNDHFPGRAAGLDSEWYEFSRLDGAVLGFRAGSYSGYNNWREWLAKLAGYPEDPAEDLRHRHSGGAWKADGGPFWELIYFADNEGTIGPIVSAKLAKDFAEWDERAKAFSETIDADAESRAWFYRQYQTWRHAFEMAADNGAVDFH
jgi:hypothetical protein